MLRHQNLLRGALVALLFCIAALWLTPSAKGIVVSPQTTIFNDPVIWWQPFYWDNTELLETWATTQGSLSTTIAFVGTGIKPVDDLASHMVPKDKGHNVLNNSEDTVDMNGHDTMVASAAAAISNNGIGTIGVCPMCSIMPIKAAGSDGFATLDDLAKGVNWAANNGADVIVVAFSSDEGECSESFNEAVDYATYEKNAVVVIAAGNGTLRNSRSDNVGTDNPNANCLAAENPEAIRTANAESPDNGATLRLNPSSNRGKRLADVSVYATWIPVDTIKNSEVPAGASGTSLAAGIVGGGVGVIRSLYPWLTPAQIKAVVVGGCNPVDPDMPCGGVFSAYKALVLAATPPESVYLHLKISGKGKVWITGQPVCTTANCRRMMVAGTVGLSATPTQKGWHFVRWTGGISSRTARLSIDMETAMSIKAVFVQNATIKKSKVKRR
jgi:hypothetical protein